MKKTLLLVMISLFFMVSDSMAWDFGFCYRYDTPINISISHQFENEQEASEEEYNLRGYGFGFLFDHNPEKFKYFQYRLELFIIDYVSYDLNFKDRVRYDGSDAELKISGSGFTIRNSFGLGVNIKSSIRIWGGLEIAFGQHGLKSDWNGKNNSPFSGDWRVSENGTTNVSGIGLTVGINFYYYGKRGAACFPVKVTYLDNSSTGIKLPRFIGASSMDLSEQILTISVGIMYTKNKDQKAGTEVADS